MFLLEPGQTAYDLRWRMFGVDVRVHPMFWLVSAIMGFNLLAEPESGVPRFFVWVACVFVSILIHELGHVFMFRVCGTSAKVVLYAFGGLAIPIRPLYDRWQRIAVSFAGPLAGFLVVLAIAAGLAMTDMERLMAAVEHVLAMFGKVPRRSTYLGLPPLVEETVYTLIYINLFWGLLNLLPIWPLDGGHISRDFLDGFMPGGQGVRAALGISLVLAAVLAIHCLAATRGLTLIPFLPGFGGGYTAVMFGLLAVESFQLLQQQSSPPWRRDDW
jgi:Zn-dependent protease